MPCECIKSSIIKEEQNELLRERIKYLEVQVKKYQSELIMVYSSSSDASEGTIEHNDLYNLHNLSSGTELQQFHSSNEPHSSNESHESFAFRSSMAYSKFMAIRASQIHKIVHQQDYVYYYYDL
jgi:hypothetical protein